MNLLKKNISLTIVCLAVLTFACTAHCFAQEEKKSTWKQALREQKHQEKRRAKEEKAIKKREAEASRTTSGKADGSIGANGMNGMANSAEHSAKKGYVMGYTVENGDTIYLDKLPPAYALNREVYKSKKKEWRKHYKLIYNFKKAYPYALQAKKIAHQVDSIVAARHLTGKAQEEFVKQCEAELFKQFEKPLKNLTVSQGRLLMKLIDREIGLTTFYVIKNYKGRFKAFFWQGVARLFGSNLKTPYDRFGADKEVEKLVKMWEDGSFDALYFSIFYK